MTNRVIVIDGNLLIHKSQHVFKKLSVKANGSTIDTGIAYGFIRAIMRLNKLYRPCETCIVFDNSMNITSPNKGEEDSYRKEILPGYKAGRKHKEELIDGVRLLFRFLKTLPVTILYPSVKYEADDLVSYVVRRAFEDHILGPKGKYEVIVVSDDKDFNQLIHVTDGFSVVVHKKGDKIWNVKKFRKAFGFAPERYVAYLALLGDKGDNIPGVHGYGKVKASALVRDNRSEEISNKLSEEEAKIFVTNMILISLSPHDEVVSKTYKSSLDREKFNQLAKKYKMVSFLRKDEQETLEDIKSASFIKEK
jgi:5'-3' exonuclease